MFQNIHDLAELAKAGFKPNDIKELLELANTQPEKAPDDSGNDNKEPDENISDTDKDEGSAPDPIEAIIKRNEGD